MRTIGHQFWLSTVTLVLLTGCQTTAPLPEPQRIVWPAPPEDARIEYVGSLRRPADLGIQHSGFRRLISRVFGAGSAELLVKPFGLALDEHDNLCVTDTGANTVNFYDRQKKQWHRWERIGAVPFVTPVAVAKSNDVFYVADPGHGAVIAFNTAGKLRWTATNELSHPAGLVLAAGKLFVVDSHRHRVVSFDLSGNFVAAFGQRGKGPGQFNFPTHLATDGAGHLYVTDSMNGRVQVFDLAGNFQSEFGEIGDAPGYFSRPKGVAVDSLGHVYVGDANFDNSQIFDPTGRILLSVGAAGSAPGEFWLPNGIAISRQNEIFVADCYNHRVQIFQYVGQP